MSTPSIRKLVPSVLDKRDADLFQDHPVTGKRSLLNRERRPLGTLAMLIHRNRDELLARWRREVTALPSAQHLDQPTLNDHIPSLIEELATAFDRKSDETIAEAVRDWSPPAHGVQRLKDGFDIEEVVAEYNILRGCVHDLAEANGLGLDGQTFHILNRLLDGAIGLAVKAYATQRALDIQARREEYLAFVAHDLRTPLQAISLAANVIERGDNTPMIKSLHRNVQRLEALVGKVLDENSNLQTDADVKLERRALDLWPLVEGVMQGIHPIAGTASTRITNEVPDDLVVFADAGLLRRVFQNLIANAIVYTPRGEVRIGAQEHAKDSAVECWVSDTGTGIPADLLDKVFAKGAGDPEKEGSTGLGLAIVKTFVEAHEGTVRVESEEGHGTTIRFTLPHAAPQIPPAGA